MQRALSKGLPSVPLALFLTRDGDMRLVSASVQIRFGFHCRAPFGPWIHAKTFPSLRQHLAPPPPLLAARIFNILARFYVRLGFHAFLLSQLQTRRIPLDSAPFMCATPA